MKTASQISACLADKASVVTQYLLPQGQLEHHQWHAKDDENHFVINTNGEDKGQWRNHSNQQSGDLLDLWCITRNLSLAEAVYESKRWLGIKNENLFSPGAANGFEIDINHYTPLDADSAQMQQLIDKYKLTPNNIHQYHLYENKDWLIYPYYKNNSPKQLKCVKNTKIRYAVKRHTALFGWQAFPPMARTVVLTLSEIDTMSLNQYGIPSLAIPMEEDAYPSLAWLADEFEYLVFDKIYFAWRVTQQTRGFTEQLRERLGLHRCYQIQLPCDSANECLQQGVTEQTIRSYIDTAKTSDPDELKSAADYTDDVLKLINPDGNHHAYQPPWQKCQSRIAFKPNELSIWTGINGHGKSQLLGYLMLHFMRQGAKVCIASLELKPERVLLRLNRQLLASGELDNESIEQAQAWYHDRLWLFNLVGSTKTERLLSVFEYARQRYGIDVFLIDSIMKCGINEDDYNAQKQFVDELCDFKNEHPCHIHLVAHPRKSQDENHLPNKMDIKGTGSMTDLADNVFTVWRNKDKADGEADAVLQCDKQRNGEWEGKIKLWFDLKSCHYLETAHAVTIPVMSKPI